MRCVLLYLNIYFCYGKLKRNGNCNNVCSSGETHVDSITWLGPIDTCTELVTLRGRLCFASNTNAKTTFFTKSEENGISYMKEMANDSLATCSTRNSALVSSGIFDLNF